MDTKEGKTTRRMLSSLVWRWKSIMISLNDYLVTNADECAHTWWLLLILMYNFQFLFIEVKRQRDWWKWESGKEKRSELGGWGLEIILIFINIHSYGGKKGKGKYHSFENVKINIINDIVFIIVLRSFFFEKQTYRRIRVWKSQPLWHLFVADTKSTLSPSRLRY